MPTSPRALLPGLLAACSLAAPACSAPGPAAPSAPSAPSAPAPSPAPAPAASSPTAAPSASAPAPAPESPGWQTRVSPRAPPSRLGIPAIRGTQVMLGDVIAFEPGKATLRMAESEAALLQLKTFLDSPDVNQVRIEGHIASDGNANLRLSGQRALAVVRWLTDQGVDRARLIAVGFGDLRPIDPGDTPASKARNTRIDVHVTRLLGENYKGADPTGGGEVFK